MVRICRYIAASLLAAAIVVAPARPDTPQEQAALAVATTLVRDAHDAMTAADLGEAARFERLKGVVSAAFAFDVWEKFLIGDREFSEAERGEFRDLLPGFLARLYADRFGKGLEAEPMVTGSRTVRNDVMVAAEIPRANRKSLPVEYRVRTFEDRGPLVIDVMVGGVSFLVLKRDEFRAMIDSKGIASLLAFMRENAT